MFLPDRIRFVPGSIELNPIGFHDRLLHIDPKQPIPTRMWSLPVLCAVAHFSMLPGI